MSGATEDLIISNNEQEEITVNNGAYQFSDPLPYNGAWNVQIVHEPYGQKCVVSPRNGHALVDVDFIDITCQDIFYEVSGWFFSHHEEEEYSSLYDIVLTQTFEDVSSTFTVNP